MWSWYRVFGTQTGAFRKWNVENSIRNFLLVQRLAFLIARSMGIYFRMLDIVATDPVQASLNLYSPFSSSSFLAPFPRSFKFPHINSPRFSGSQHLHYGPPTISTSHSYFQERSASAFMTHIIQIRWLKHEPHTIPEPPKSSFSSSPHRFSAPN